eukprot:Blabericola_migrator_1__8364@NODE_4351_length_1207_cov_11_460526_g2690_i0_p1_GENE_NODE_4351_length_1207_cov_11_460526_g2690_i0NODE_4351_length_1207_cov_11_460526_g2690_i0_p1_ORF_typecomplete_len110_score17_53Methyltransf_PK/PF05891_12/5_2e19_NODE_4351_length_1207_cov_11_460526_g2690_i0239568
MSLPYCRPPIDQKKHPMPADLDSVRYWGQQCATVDGVMGGFGHLNAIDVKDSQRILNKVLKMLQKQQAVSWDSAADVGAGIGRCTSDVLAKFGFKEVSRCCLLTHLFLL